jgi:hypothetical protein
MVKELDKESRDILESKLQKNREEPLSKGVKGNPITSDSARIDIEAKNAELDKMIDQYDTIISLAEEVEKIVEQRGENVQVKFDADENITLRDSIRRVFGIDTDIVTYEMYKTCLELREQLAEEDRKALKEQ